MSFPEYFPNPTRVWSRVQSACTYQPDAVQSFNNFDKQLLEKGNILQYKNNSSNLTKQQKYAQLVRGGGPSRRKSYATQTQKYTNPNTNSFKRVNSIEIPFSTTIVGYPNNISGPYQFNVPNPNGCPGNNLESGGTLICDTIVNPCTKQIIQIFPEKQTCFPITASDVPGFSNPSVLKNLCWNSNQQTWYPRQRYKMSNSGNKWPINYKGLVSAYNVSVNPTCIDENFNKYLDSILNNVNDFGTGGGTGGRAGGETMYTKINYNNTFNKLIQYLEEIQLSINAGNTINEGEFIEKYSKMTDEITTNVIYENGENSENIEKGVTLKTPKKINTINKQYSTNTKDIQVDYITPEDSSNFFLEKNIIEMRTLQATIDLLAQDVYSRSLETALGNLYNNVGKDLLVFTNKYSLGLVDELQLTFTYDVYHKLVSDIFNETFPLSDNFTYLRAIVTDSIEGLYQTTLKNVSYKAEITKLNHIIEQLRNDNGGEIFNVKTTLGTIAEIRPEITRYIQQYGFPQGGVFDTDKLGEILAELNLS